MPESVPSANDRSKAVADTTLGEAEAKAWLVAAGIPTPRGVIAASTEEAQQRARELRAPFVVKGVVEGVVHKSDLGLVRVGIRDTDEIASAFTQISDAVERHGLTAGFTGCLVEEMIDGGVEMLVSARRDHEAGPIIVIGTGGLTAELANDVTVAVAPIDGVRAREMLDSLAQAKLLHGFRGTPPADVAALCAAMVALSESFVADEALQEIEINPLLVREAGHGVVALDAVATTRIEG